MPVLPFARGRGRTALHWHDLKRESLACGRAIVCTNCVRPHVQPPRFGICGCGCSYYAIEADNQLPLQLVALDFHGGEQ
jgi:single-stranded DNA-specific DHH superfamily exonuclease